MTLECGEPRGEAELLAFARILGWSFGFEADAARGWLDVGGLPNVRIARSAGRTLGGLLEVPMAQWFGGQSVPMLGLAGVAVAPEARGEHVALSMVLESLRAARGRGLYLSMLYPATVTLYRAAGYELAGSRHRFTFSLNELKSTRSRLRVLPLELSEEAAVEALYRRKAAERPGYLERGPYVWRRVRETKKGERHPAFGVHGERGLEGYVYLSQGGAEGQREIVVHDFAVATADAAARLLGFFADHRSTIKTLRLYGTSQEELLLALPERSFRSELADHWMLRILDVAGALSARGYPPIDARVDLELDDRTLPENSGRYRLEVRAGRASVTRGGDGSVTLDERALAALYSGFLTPQALSRSTTLRGDDTSLASLALLFAGAPPSMSDFF